MMRHIASISGGKDSTALLILAKLERGVDIQAVFADTGHEHPLTYEYLEYLDKVLGPIQTVRADFTRQIMNKREFIKRKWAEDGVPKKKIEDALAVLYPTGNPFLDLCLWKSRFPSTRARFCSQELKHEPIRALIEPWIADGETVISWQGVRADESLSRANLDIVDDPEPGLITYRPLIRYTAQEVFDLHRKHGIQWNPLYEQGCGRVGCMPCIHARKGEIKEIANRWPEVIDRVYEWERRVSYASKRGSSTFYNKSNAVAKTEDELSNMNYKTHGIHQIVDWAKTTRGGQQYDLFAINPSPEELEMCSSIYGLCESAE